MNHLFIESTHEATGYFEYDSTQNFASLKGGNEFTVYQQLGTNDKKSTTTMIAIGWVFWTTMLA